MIRSNLYDYSDSYMHFKGTIAVPNTAGADSTVNNTNKKVIFRNCAPFTDCMSEINNTQADINIALSICNLIEYSNAYQKTSGSLWECYRDEPALDSNNNIIDFPTNNNNSISFKFKQQITGKTGNDGTKDVSIMVPLKYLSNFWRTLETTLINVKFFFS